MREIRDGGGSDRRETAEGEVIYTPLKKEGRRRGEVRLSVREK
jgi:hypothetical protein